MADGAEHAKRKDLDRDMLDAARAMLSLEHSAASPTIAVRDAPHEPRADAPEPLFGLSELNELASDLEDYDEHDDAAGLAYDDLYEWGLGFESADGSTLLGELKRVLSPRGGSDAHDAAGAAAATADAASESRPDPERMRRDAELLALILEDDLYDVDDGGDGEHSLSWDSEYPISPAQSPKRKGADLSYTASGQTSPLLSSRQSSLPPKRRFEEYFADELDNLATAGHVGAPGPGASHSAALVGVSPAAPTAGYTDSPGHYRTFSDNSASPSGHIGTFGHVNIALPSQDRPSGVPGPGHGPMQTVLSAFWSPGVYERATPSEQRMIRGATLLIFSCCHAATAAKSYSGEKRFLCPTPFASIRSQPALGIPPEEMLQDAKYFNTLTAQCTILNGTVEAGETLSRQDKLISPHDRSHWRSHFRTLHISASKVAGIRNFTINVDIKDTERSLYAFSSDSIPIISKPCRSIPRKCVMLAAAIRDGSMLALYNRINSQTLRTRYLNLDGHEFSTDAENWDPLAIQVVQPPPFTHVPDDVRLAYEESLATTGSTATPVLYGSIIRLRNVHWGHVSGLMRIFRVAEGGALSTQCGPVLQLQKIAFVAVDGVSSFEDDVSALARARSLLATDKEGCIVQTRPSVAKETLKLADDSYWTVAGVCETQTRIIDVPEEESASAASGTRLLSQHPLTTFPHVLGPPTTFLQADSAGGAALATLVNFEIGRAADHGTDAGTGFARTHAGWQVYLGYVGPMEFRWMPKRSGSDIAESQALQVKMPYMADEWLAQPLPLLLVQELWGSGGRLDGHRVYFAGADVSTQY